MGKGGQVRPWWSTSTLALHSVWAVYTKRSCKRQLPTMGGLSPAGRTKAWVARKAAPRRLGRYQPHAASVGGRRPHSSSSHPRPKVEKDRSRRGGAQPAKRGCCRLRHKLGNYNPKYVIAVCTLRSLLNKDSNGVNMKQLLIVQRSEQSGRNMTQLLRVQRNGRNVQLTNVKHR